jgi:FKBP-type peptidyl-prolyl cis-trans isomerase 2
MGTASTGARAEREFWGQGMRIEAGKVVCLEYVLSLVDGTLIDSTEGSGLWTYVHGETRMPPGLSRGIEGLAVGAHARLELAPEEAFGAVDPRAFQDVPKEMVPTVALRVGYTGELPGPGGTLIPFRIHAIHDDTVTLNLNHPLAGEQVIFEVWVRHVQD